eukprot:s1974_g3.t1
MDELRAVSEDEAPRVQCMSLSLEGLSERVDLLTVQVEDLTAAVARLRLELRRGGGAPAGLARSEGASSVGLSSTSGGYNALATEIPTVSGAALALCTRLTGGSLTARQRAERAWESGWWARFVLEGRVARPRPSSPIDLANSCYIILRAEGFECPLLVQRASDYRSIVGDFSRDTLSHGFASQAEARVSLQEGVEEPYVLFWPPTGTDAEEGFASLAYVVMRRAGGFLVCVPTGFLPVEELQAADVAGDSSVLGPHATFSLPATHRVGAELVASGYDIEVQVADVAESAERGLVRLADCTLDEGLILAFSDSLAVLPDPQALLTTVIDWVASNGAQRATFYSAEEGGPPMTPGAKAKANAKAKAERPKRQPAAQAAAEQIKSIATLLPSMAAQLASLQQSQDRMQEELQQRHSRPPPRASQMPATMSPQDFAMALGAPPKTKGLSLAPPPPPAKMGLVLDSQLSPQEQLEEGQEWEEAHTLARAMLEQSRALTALVSHIQQGDPLMDVPGTSSSTSSRGAQGREKLQRELAARSGNFFLTVLQNMHRRLRPAMPLPATLEQMAQTDISMVQYLERFGGYGNVKDMGVVQYALAFIVDMALRGDLVGLQEHLGFLIVGIEQYAQDGRWELGFLLTLLEDPPHQMWSYRNPVATSTGRIRAFAPLCPQRWATISLAYLKELDFIQNRRTETTKKDQNAVQPAQPSPKRRGGKFSKAKASFDRGDKKGASYENLGEVVCTESRPEEVEFDGPADGNVFQPSSLHAWADALARSIFKSSTTFSRFVLFSIRSCRGSRFAPSTALFPIPMPLEDVWSSRPRALGKQRRDRIAVRKTLQLCIVALNYMYLSAPFASLKNMRRCPSPAHLSLYKRLTALIKAGGPAGKFFSAGCGRKSVQFGARIEELTKVLQSLGLSERQGYTTGRGVSVAQVNDKEELRPYRPLDSSRLKISGEGSWDCRPFLSDLFFMPFVEPRINEFEVKPPQEFVPDMSSVIVSDIVGLCKVWDARGLLRLFPCSEGPGSLRRCCKVFNNYKNLLQDRQIGDRRYQNFLEGRIPGPSQGLPTGVALLQIAPLRFVEKVLGSVADRRDFYHQFWITDERSTRNCIHHELPWAEVAHLDAAGKLVRRAEENKQHGKREAFGDNLRNIEYPVAWRKGDDVAACFGALFQGDHLGVEFACDAHSSLLSTASLLREGSTLCSKDFLVDDRAVNGLVIDDFFSLSREGLSLQDIEDSESVRDFRKAKAIYKDQGLQGSDDKDVVGADRFVVVGAEVISTEEDVKRGVVSVAAPFEKRLGLATCSAIVAATGFTSDALHASLVGAWVSVLTFRRQAMAVMN